MNEPSILTQPGRFVVGCNYWASHAGTRMWSHWDVDVIREDLRLLSDSGLQVLRVFPLWPDFQPLHLHRAGSGEPVEFRHGESSFPDDEAGRAGVDPVMLERFRLFADLADRHRLKLIVGLITGWMSGKLFIPPGLDGLNVLTDPVAIQWQVRMVRLFVRRFSSHPAVLAWDLGNECNCMAEVPNSAAAWAWTHAITSAIRIEDSSRPIVSGMHSLQPAFRSHWRMQDQGELTDLLTTHPYPYFTPHCDLDPANTIRTILHSTAESRYYADIGKKPCLVEEIGTLGPFLASEGVAADFVRSCLFSLFAHDCHGLLWWCAFDQLHLEHAPYDWAACERELGLIRQDRSIKPVLDEIGRIRKLFEKILIKPLPAHTKEAVCILTEGQDQWAAAFSTFILAKQAGFDLEFQYADQPLKPARLYLVPSVCGMSSMSRRRWLDLLKAVEQGATLYLSHNDCLLSPFTAPFGLEILTRERRSAPARFEFIAEFRNHWTGFWEIASDIRLNIKPTTAEVLAREIDGNPLFTTTKYGQGSIYFLALPLETALAQQPGAFHHSQSPPYWRIFQLICEPFLRERVAHKRSPNLGLTEHPVDDHHRLVIAVNYSPAELHEEIFLKPGWELDEVFYGAITRSGDKIYLKTQPNDGSILLLRFPD